MLNIFFQNRFNARYIMLVLLLIVLLFAVMARHHGVGVDAAPKEETPAVRTLQQDVEDALQADVEEGSHDAFLRWALAKVADATEPDQSLYETFEGGLFIGDSRTEGMKFYSGVENADFFSGKSMNVSKVLKGEQVNVGGTDISLQDLLGQNTYTRVYICLGINELGWTSKDSFTEEYGKLIDLVQEKQPEAAVFVELLFPVSAKKSASDKVFNNTNIQTCNDRLTALAAEKQVASVDPSPPLVDESGALKADATSDGIHINREYCVRWAEYLAIISK